MDFPRGVEAGCPRISRPLGVEFDQTGVIQTWDAIVLPR